MADQTMRRTAPLAVHANFAWSFAGKAIYAVCRAALLILVAKLGTAAMVGQYAFAFAVTTPVFMLADLDLRSVLATDPSDRLEFGHYAGLRLATTALAMAAVCAVALLQADAQTAWITLLVGIAKAFEAMSDIYYGVLQKHERMNRLGISLMLKGLFSVLAMGLTLWLTRSLPAGVAGLALAWLLLLFLYDIPACRAFARVRPALEPRRLWGLARLSLPLGAVLLFATLNRNMSSYFVQAFLGSEQLGYFSAMLYLLTAGSLVASALGQSVNARLARLFGRGDTRGFAVEFGKAAAFTAAAGAVVLLGCALFGGPLLSLLYTPEYAAYSGVFTVVMCGAGVSYVCDLTSYAVTATRRFQIQPCVHGCALALAVLFNRLLVPQEGLLGAAWCVAAVSCLQLGGNLAVLVGTVRKKRLDTLERAEEEKSGVRVEVFTRVDALPPALLAGWEEILTLKGCDLPYARPGWLRQWQEAYGRGGEPQVLAVYAGGGLIGVLPLACRKRLFVRSVTLMGAPQACYADLALRPGREDEAARAMLARLGRMGGAIVYRFSGLPEGGDACRALQRQLAARRFPRFASRAPCYAVNTQGKSFREVYEARFSGRAAGNARKAEAKLKRLGSVRIAALGREDMKEAFELHEKRWSRKLDTSDFCARESRKFFTALIAETHDGWSAEALGVFLDERLIAFLYGFRCGGRYHAYTLAHDDLFGFCSPGGMALRETVRRCAEAGVAAVDLGPGYEDYKLEWADERRQALSLTFSPRGVAPLPFLLALRALEAARAGLKRSRRAVLFKRNTLGRVKHALSPAGLPAALRRSAMAARRAGVRAYVMRALRLGRARRYALKPQSPEIARSLPRDARAADFRDAQELGLLLGLPPGQVIRRFSRGERCQAVKRDGRIAFSGWMKEEDGQMVARDFRSGGPACTERDILCVLLGLFESFPRGRPFVLELGSGDGAVKRAAQKAGALRETRPGPPKQAPQEKKGGLRHADADR